MGNYFERFFYKKVLGGKNYKGRIEREEGGVVGWGVGSRLWEERINGS